MGTASRIFLPLKTSSSKEAILSSTDVSFFPKNTVFNRGIRFSATSIWSVQSADWNFSLQLANSFDKESFVVGLTIISGWGDPWNK